MTCQGVSLSAIFAPAQISPTCFEGVPVLSCGERVVAMSEALSMWDSAMNVLRKHGRVVLDFSSAEALDSCGIGYLVLLHRWAWQNGCRVVLAALGACASRTRIDQAVATL